MPSKARKWKFRIQHILAAIDECQQFVAGMTYEQFCADVKTLKAVVWNLMMIGEAAGHIPAHIQKAYANVPWAQMRGMRNHIVHGYDHID